MNVLMLFCWTCHAVMHVILSSFYCMICAQQTALSAAHVAAVAQSLLIAC